MNHESISKPDISHNKPFYKALFRFPKPKSGSENNFCNIPNSNKVKSISKSLIADNKINLIINKLGLIKKVYDHVYPFTFPKGMSQTNQRINSNLVKSIDNKISMKNTYSIPNWMKMKMPVLETKYPEKKKNMRNKTSWGTFYQYQKRKELFYDCVL